jgi:hypothetical protein
LRSKIATPKLRVARHVPKTMHAARNVWLSMERTTARFAQPDRKAPGFSADGEELAVLSPDTTRAGRGPSAEQNQ